MITGGVQCMDEQVLNKDERNELAADTEIILDRAVTAIRVLAQIVNSPVRPQNELFWGQIFLFLPATALGHYEPLLRLPGRVNLGPTFYRKDSNNH